MHLGSAVVTTMVSCPTSGSIDEQERVHGRMYPQWKTGKLNSPIVTPITPKPIYHLSKLIIPPPPPFKLHLLCKRPQAFMIP